MPDRSYEAVTAGLAQVFAKGDHVTVESMGGVAFWYVRDCDTNHPDCVIVVMVGDDVGHHKQRDELKPLDEDEFCGSCGQIGCLHG